MKGNYGFMFLLHDDDVEGKENDNRKEKCKEIKKGTERNDKRKQ